MGRNDALGLKEGLCLPSRRKRGGVTHCFSARVVDGCALWAAPFWTFLISRPLQRAKVILESRSPRWAAGRSVIRRSSLVLKASMQFWFYFRSARSALSLYRVASSFCWVSAISLLNSRWPESFPVNIACQKHRSKGGRSLAILLLRVFSALARGPRAFS